MSNTNRGARSTSRVNQGGVASNRQPSGPPLPELIGRYRVQERAGSGGFGEVFRALDPQLDREIAIKLPRPGVLTTPEQTLRFLREGKAAARLNHPNIVPVYDTGHVGDNVFITSKYIRGKSLAELIHSYVNDWRRIATLVKTLAEALHYAHHRQIVHRDIKPHNILVDAEGEPHITDFGLARLESDGRKLTHDGAILGTPAYMSPEQVKSAAVTAASDQYSLGVVLYELLTGDTPFAGPPSVVIYNLLNTAIPSPRIKNAAIPSELETICLKAMSQQATQRYADCGAMAEDLRRFLADEPIIARKDSWWKSFRRWCRRNPVVFGLSTTVVLISATGFTATLLALRDAREARDAAQSHLLRSEKFAKEAQASRDIAVASEKLALEREAALQESESALKLQNERLTSILAELEEARDSVKEMEETSADRVAAEESKRAQIEQALEVEREDRQRLKTMTEQIPLLSYRKNLEAIQEALRDGNHAKAASILDDVDRGSRGIEWRILRAAAQQELQVSDKVIELTDFAHDPTMSIEPAIATDSWFRIDNTFIRMSDAAITTVESSKDIGVAAVSPNGKYVALQQARSRTVGASFICEVVPPLFEARHSRVDISKKLSSANGYRSVLATDDGGVVCFPQEKGRKDRLEVVRTRGRGNDRLYQTELPKVGSEEWLKWNDPGSQYSLLSWDQPSGFLVFVLGKRTQAKAPVKFRVIRLSENGDVRGEWQSSVTLDRFGCPVCDQLFVPQMTKHAVSILSRCILEGPNQDAFHGRRLPWLAFDQINGIWDTAHDRLYRADDAGGLNVMLAAQPREAIVKIGFDQFADKLREQLIKPPSSPYAQDSIEGVHLVGEHENPNGTLSLLYFVGNETEYVPTSFRYRVRLVHRTIDYSRAIP